eukprot:15341436-Ditylum_brightwellii.AAC.1
MQLGDNVLAEWAKLVPFLLDVGGIKGAVLVVAVAVLLCLGLALHCTTFVALQFAHYRKFRPRYIYVGVEVKA